jgi:hypothetical protein
MTGEDKTPQGEELLGLAGARRIFAAYMAEHPPSTAGELVVGDVWRADDDFFLPRWDVRRPAMDGRPEPVVDNSILLIDRKTGRVVQDYFTPNYARIKAMREVSVANEPIE